MTLAEFKAWFEGFTEDMDGAPNAKQWKRIKARVKEVNGSVITREVWRDHYLPYWTSQPYVGSPNDVVLLSASSKLNAVAPEFDSGSAMYALGKSEASSVAA